MSDLTVPPSKRLVLLSGRAHPELGEEVAARLGTDLCPIDAYEFANGEIFVRFKESVRGCDAFVMQSHTTPINTWIMEQLIMVDALKRASAKRITVIAPFYGYARQDKKHRGREPISARLMADLFKSAGADRLITVDLHTSQIQGFFDGPVDHLFALPLLATHVSERVERDRITVVSPDAGRVRVAEKWTDILGAPLAIIHKRRDPDTPNEVRVLEVVGDVRDRVCVVVDDMIDTGGTIVKAADVLFDNGAAEVIVAATHGILSEPAAQRLQESRISEVIVTNTLPIPSDRQFDKLTILSIAPLLAQAVYEVFTDGSVTRMFESPEALLPFPT
ncbi:MAG: ribose-phosphate diphosphokinase [Candidatus Nanopelagicales bacterium]